MKVYEGSIVTCDAHGTVGRFLAEDGGKIVYVGQSLPHEYEAAPRVRLGEKSLLPAFGDTHIHFLSYAFFAAGLDLRAAKSIAEIQAAIADFAKERAPAYVIGFGASAYGVVERRLLTKDDIDAVCPDRPVFITKYDGHAAIANSALISKVAGKLGALRGFDSGSGLMTQEAFFRITDFITGTISLPSTLGNMLAGIDTLAGYGIGLVHSVTGIGFPADMDVSLESLFARGLANPLAYRIFFQTMDVEKVLKRKLPRIGGCFATALDGCFGSMDAALLQPYGEVAGPIRGGPAHGGSAAQGGLAVGVGTGAAPGEVRSPAPGPTSGARTGTLAGWTPAPARGAGPGAERGVLYYPDEKVRAFCMEANRRGLQIEMHAIGDAAFDQAVGALAAVLADFPREDHRHTIIHACLPTPRGLEICAKLNIRIAVQPSFLQWEQEPLEYIESILGDRAYAISPLRTMTDMGIQLSGGSDAPCTVPDPIEGIWAACNHYVPGQSLSIQEALDLYTRKAAEGSFDEKDRGSLETGKLADMVILNRNPLSLAPAALRSLKVESLLLRGNPYQPGQGLASLIARGLLGVAGKGKRE